MIHSISWRLQISYGLLLCAAFAGLGITAYHLERNDRLKRIDEGLQARANRLTGILFRHDRPPNPTGEPTELAAAEHGTPQGEPGGRVRHYYLVWSAGPEVNLRHKGGAAPDVVPTPPAAAEIPREGFARTRDGWRERILLVRREHILLVGRDVSGEMAELRTYGFQLMLVGLGILSGGLLLSAWLSKRALKPIDDISEAATRIARGALDERVDVGGNRSELGRLAEVLNHTFDELADAYHRQAQFTADASHELRTPLAVILSEIQSGPETLEEHRESLAVCEESARSMRQLVEQLLELARFDAGTARAEFTTVDLRDLAESCVEKVAALAAKKEIEIVSEFEAEVTCKGEVGRLDQVLTNLLTNAIAYNRKGGRIVVRAKRDGNDAVVEVEDNGFGISEDDLPHVFERFYRADKSRTKDGHSGLGLAISKEIATSHGGELTVESVLGEGSTFRLRIPFRSTDLSRETRSDLVR